MVNKSKNIDVRETIEPIIINGFDCSVFIFLSFSLDKDLFLSFLFLRKFEKGLRTVY